MNKLKDIFDIKKVMSLTKILCKDYFEKLPIFRSKDSTQGKIYKLCLIVGAIGLIYLSYYIIDFLQQTSTPQIFLSAYLLIMAIIIIFQQILASTNVYYFSKDLEYILPFPIKPIELLVARFNMLVTITYVSMAVFLFTPLIIYGLMAGGSIFYFPGMIIVAITFPIFFGLIISSIMLVVMQLSKIIKNKDIFQMVVTFIIMSIFTIFEMLAITSILSNEGEIGQALQGESVDIISTIDYKIKEVNNYLITINPSVNILTGKNILINIIELIKITLANIIAFIIFIFIGKKLYLNNILINIQKINSKKIKDKKQKNNKYKNNTKEKAYIKNEFRELIKTPAFFLQCVCPTILIVIALTAVFINIYPSINVILTTEEVVEQLPEFTLDLSVLVLITVIMQLMYTFSNLSITAISRKGKNAFFVKFIPISLYKQFLYLNLPQIILNIFISLIILGAAKYLIAELTIIHLIILFIIGLILNIINSFLMLVVDLRKPNLEWDNETDAIKQNKNKLYQYVLTIIISLLLIYLQSIFVKINLNLILGILLILIILLIILFLINIIIKNKINKLFNKII